MTVVPIQNAAQPQIMSGASMRMPPQQKMTNLYNKIDTSGEGVITQAQFNQAFQTQKPPAVFQAQGAAAIWQQLDPNNTGSVSKQDFVNTMKQLMASLRAAPGQTSGAAIDTLTGSN